MKVGEGLALPITFIVMVLVFGGFLAAGLPLLGAIASISGALGTLLGFSHLLDLDATVVNIVTVLGLGLSIDYGLLVVSRFREEMRGRLQGREAASSTREELVEAVGATLDRAGRTVLFSGLTVGISLGGLLFFQADIMRAIGAAGVSVVGLAMLVALTLVPALCALSARRLLRRGTEVAPDEGVFSRLASAVQRAPWLVIAAVLAILLGSAVPALSMRLTASGAELLPVTAPERVFFETLARDYPALTGAQVTVVAHDTPIGTVRDWAASAANLPGVVAVDPPVAVGNLVTVGLRTTGNGLGEPARSLTSHLRANRPPFPAYVVGQSSALADFVAAARQRAPYAVGTVALATLVLLFLMTGSVVIPVKALLMNVVSLGASLGVVTWVFQDGHGAGLLHFASVGALEQVIPLLVLAFGFGLSMDYEVFLLSRIVELREQGHDTDAAVRLGLQRSGRIITSAAVLMVIVFSGFVTAQVLVIKQTGVALVLAVALDATLVRMLLVPATMTVLGRFNWWAPALLRRLHDRVGITH
jgi:RND superfamily putative drug exporter